MSFWSGRVKPGARLPMRAVAASTFAVSLLFLVASTVMLPLFGAEGLKIGRRLRLGLAALGLVSYLPTLANGEYRSKMRPASVLQSIMAFSVRYNLPVFFCPDRDYAARVVESLLTKYAREMERRWKALSERRK